MEEQIPPSQPPVQQMPEGQISLEQLAEMKARARDLAFQQAFAQQAAQSQQAPKVVYLRRNLTVAELLIVLLISCGIVTGIQWSWNFVSNALPKIEIKVR